MASQSILWTTLPYGPVTLKDGSPALRVSIFVSPRLKPDADETLNPFELFHQWPARIADLKFKLVVEGGGGGELVPLPGEDRPDVELWTRLFDKRTFVRGFQFMDLQQENIRSFPAAPILAYMQDLYGQTAAQHGDDFPPHGPGDESPLAKLKADLGRLNDGRHRGNFDRLVDDALKEGKIVPKKLAGFSSAAEAVFYQASRFYDRKKAAGSNDYAARPDPKFKAVPVAKPEFDFHQALAAFGDYPRFMRRLGLVIDCVWKETAPIPATGRVRVEVSSAKPEVTRWLTKDKPAWTNYIFNRRANLFRAVAKDGADTDLTRGLLNLRSVADAAPGDQAQSPYVISQLDVDGSALKLVNTAGSLARMDSARLTNFRTPRKSDLPSLRTLGLALYKSDRAAERHAHLLRAAALQQTLTAVNGQPAYFADDLLRGYRVDVWDDVTKVWHPLCLRQGDYFLTKRGAMQLALQDEGYVKSASVSRGDPAVETDLYLHERLLAFDGWSLVAARPGKTLATDPTAPEPIEAPLSAQTEFGLMTRFAPPPGTLPRLRFGRSYRLRVRLVDIAGNSIGFDEAGEFYASKPFHFTRFEPVPSPVLVPRARVTEGESLEHLVIRSDFDRTAKAYAADPVVIAVLKKVHARLKLPAKAASGYAYREENERHVAPPKTSQLEAEVHGQFDDFIGPGKDHAKGYRLAAREAGTFMAKTWVDLETGNDVPIPGVEIELIPPAGATPTNLDGPNWKPGDELQAGEYVIHKEAALTVPYLPDPLAVGVAFTGLPGWAASGPLIVPFEGTWPDMKPFRIRLVERSGTLVDCAQTFPDNRKPDWNNLEKGVLTVFVAKGVSAEVRYSCVMPKEDAPDMSIWKWLDQRGDLTAAAKKRILAGGNWLLTPWRTMTLVHAVQHPLCPPTIKQWLNRRNAGETYTSLSGRWFLSVKSTAKVVIQANWQEPLDDVTKPTWQVLDRSSNVTEFPIPTTLADESFAPEELGILSKREPFHHEFGDTKHRVIKYRLKGTTRFREYFPVELTQDETAITRIGPVFTLSIPSSARPAAPQPLYVLPTFRWEETALPNNGLTRARKGNGVRVYLDRPWWSSGENERLGVIFRVGTVADADKSYVTQWGLDPAFDSVAPYPGPGPDSFPLATEVRINSSLDEKGNDQDVYAVAGHAVEFDPVRKLWFADIEVKAGGSYFPFIRLALARFQPTSVVDCHLSRVVQTDFMQLVPDRSLHLAWLSTSRVHIKIFGQAPTETNVSRVLANWGITTTSVAAKTAALSIRDLVSAPFVGAKAMEYFKQGQVEYFQAGEWKATPDVTAQLGVPVDPSTRAGLNEYTVTLEWLPEGDSPDFGWQEITGIQPTMPRTASSSAKPFTPQFDAPVENRSAKMNDLKKGTTVAKGITLPAKKKTVVVGKTPVIGAATGGVSEGVEIGPIASLTPLWEGQITMPNTHANRPRRLVVREYELYFKTFSLPDNLMPIARRLVYADIVTLP